MELNKALEKEFIVSEAQKCLLCYDAPCTKACPNKSKPSEFLRSIQLDNLSGAKKQVSLSGMNTTCIENCTQKFCEKACIRGKLGNAVKIHAVHKYLIAENEKECE